MAVPKGIKQLGWFLALWAGGVAVILTVGLIIRSVLQV